MQCPKCGYEPTLAETQRSPDDCVKCGINYAGHARHLAEQAQRKKEGAAIIKLAPAVRDATAKYPGAQPVIVIDINMGFWSMVKFMVKFAFATIPAALIITFVVSAAISAYSSYQLYTRVSQVKPTAETQRQSLAPDQINVPLVEADEYFEINRHTLSGLTVITFRQMQADGVVTYGKFQVDCAKGYGKYLVLGSIGEVLGRGLDVEEVLSPIIDGTVEKFLAQRACAGALLVAPVLR